MTRLSALITTSPSCKWRVVFAPIMAESLSVVMTVPHANEGLHLHQSQDCRATRERKCFPSYLGGSDCYSGKSFLPGPAPVFGSQSRCFGFKVAHTGRRTKPQTCKYFRHQDKDHYCSITNSSKWCFWNPNKATKDLRSLPVWPPIHSPNIGFTEPKFVKFQKVSQRPLLWYD